MRKTTRLGIKTSLAVLTVIGMLVPSICVYAEEASLADPLPEEEMPLAATVETEEDVLLTEMDGQDDLAEGQEPAAPGTPSPDTIEEWEEPGIPGTPSPDTIEEWEEPGIPGTPSPDTIEEGEEPGIPGVPSPDGPQEVEDTSMVTITFLPGEGGGEMEQMITPYQKTYILPDCGFTAPEGKVFDGWATGEENHWASPGTTMLAEHDRTYTARWKDDPEKKASESQTVTPTAAPTPAPAAAAVKTGAPDTGDAGWVLLYLAALLISGWGLLAGTARRK